MTGSDAVRAGVVGWPVSHSLSPALHGYWLKQYGIDGSYNAYEVAPGPEADILGLLEREAMAGCNLTLPHKEALLSRLDVDDKARKAGAVNTIFRKGGGWAGTNTDIYGFMASLKARVPGWQRGTALVIGAGGASRAVCAGLLADGFSVTVCNRSPGRAEALVRHFADEKLGSCAWDAVQDAMGSAELLVNATSLGMRGQAPLEISLAPLRPETWVADIVYAPERTARTRLFSNPCVTDFLARAAQKGNETIDGLDMLLYQAQPGFELWFGERPDVTHKLRSHVLEAMLGQEAKHI